MPTALRIILTMTDPDTFAKELGIRLAHVRKDRGLTQTELAEALNLSQAVIAEYEAGRKNIPTWRLMNIAEALDIEPKDLMNFGKGHATQSRRGPTPKLQRQMECISALPKDKQKSIMQVLDMALKST